MMVQRNKLAKLIQVCILTGLLLFVGCDTMVSPKYYQAEIEDVVKYNIATLDDMASNYPKNNYWWSQSSWENYMRDAESFGSIIEEMFVQTEEENGCYVALKQVSQDETNMWCEWAKTILERYESIDIVISDYQKVETSSDIKYWNFQELRSGLDGSFSLEPSGKWSVEFSDSSLEEYLESQI